LWVLITQREARLPRDEALCFSRVDISCKNRLTAVLELVGDEGLAHILRAPKNIFEKQVFKSLFASEVPLALLTPDPGVEHSSPQPIQKTA